MRAPHAAFFVFLPESHMNPLLFFLFSLLLWSLPVVIARFRKHNFIAVTSVVVFFVGLELILGFFFNKHLPLGVMAGEYGYAVFLIFTKKEYDADFVRLFAKIRKKAPPADISETAKAPESEKT